MTTLYEIIVTVTWATGNETDEHNIIAVLTNGEIEALDTWIDKWEPDRTVWVELQHPTQLTRPSAVHTVGLSATQNEISKRMVRC